MLNCRPLQQSGNSSPRHRPLGFIGYMRELRPKWWVLREKYFLVSTALSSGAWRRSLVRRHEPFDVCARRRLDEHTSLGRCDAIAPGVEKRRRVGAGAVDAVGF